MMQWVGGQDNLKDPKCNIGRQKSNVSEIMTGAMMKKTPFFKIFWATIESNIDKEDALVAAFIWKCVILFIETSRS